MNFFGFGSLAIIVGSTRQYFVGSLFNYSAVVDSDYLVGCLYRGKSVRNHDDGTVRSNLSKDNTQTASKRASCHLVDISLNSLEVVTLYTK